MAWMAACLALVFMTSGCRVSSPAPTMFGADHAPLELATTDSVFRLLLVGDTSFGERYQARLAEKGETNTASSPSAGRPS